ncbi:hypothetical protein B0H14DRAFT_3136814 [Mycena olivaceomarginata]|nr:hypothetical protein B0H14DRAFT_3136814 [Mycena olivaceomarginata]
MGKFGILYIDPKDAVAALTGMHPISKLPKNVHCGYVALANAGIIFELEYLSILYFSGLHFHGGSALTRLPTVQTQAKTQQANKLRRSVGGVWERKWEQEWRRELKEKSRDGGEMPEKQGSQILESREGGNWDVQERYIDKKKQKLCKEGNPGKAVK